MTIIVFSVYIPKPFSNSHRTARHTRIPIVQNMRRHSRINRSERNKSFTHLRSTAECRINDLFSNSVTGLFHLLECTLVSTSTPSSSHVLHNEKRRFEIRDNRSMLLRQISAIALDPLTRGRKILARRPTDNRRKTAVRIPVMLQLVYSGPYVSKVKRLRFMPQVVNIIRVDRRR